MQRWLVFSVVNSQRGFTSPVGGSECSQVGRAGCGGGVCSSCTSAPMLRSLETWRGEQPSGADWVAAGQIRKCLWPRSHFLAHSSPDLESHETGNTLRHRCAGRAWPEEPTFDEHARAPLAGKLELNYIHWLESDALAAWPSGSRST